MEGLDLSGFINPCSGLVFGSWLMMGKVDKVQTLREKSNGGKRIKHCSH